MNCKNTLIIVCIAILVATNCHAQSTLGSVDYNAKSSLEKESKFDSGFNFIITNFERNSKIIVTFFSGETEEITTEKLANSTYNPIKKELTLSFRIEGLNIFFDDKIKFQSGEIVISKPDDSILARIKKSALVPDNVGLRRAKLTTLKPTGGALIDAISLMESDSIDDCISIMSEYFDDIPSATQTKGKLIEFLNSHPNRFLKDPEVIKLFNSKGEKALIVAGDESGFISSTKSVASIVGGLDVTQIADGFAKFLVKRTKEELNVAFFERFKSEMEKPEYKDLRSVFPQTYRTLTAVGQDIYLYQAYIQTMRESFEKDLAALPSNLPTILDNHEEFFNAAPELKAVLLSGFYVGQKVQDKMHPGQIIEDYPIEYLDSVRNVKGAFQTLQLLSTSLKGEDDEDGYWVSAEIIEKVTNNDDLILKIYLGLLEQQSDSIFFENSNRGVVALSKIIDSSYDDISKSIPKYRAFVKEVVMRSRSIDLKVKSLARVNGDSLLFENYYAVVSSSVNLMRYLTDAGNLPNFPSKLNLKELTSQYFDAIQTAADITIDVNRRNYASAIVNAVHLYDLGIREFKYGRLGSLNKLRAKSIKTEKGFIATVDRLAYYRVASDIRRSDETIDLPGLLRATEVAITESRQKITVNTTDAINIGEVLTLAQPTFESANRDYLTRLIKDSIDSRQVMDASRIRVHDFLNRKIDTLSSREARGLLKYGSFMATLVQAKTSDEVQLAIEAIALPTGSARIKRVSRFNVALNAYLGLHIGDEKLESYRAPVSVSDSVVVGGWGRVYGISAPIGIAASTRLFRKLGAVSLFASLIDIGAVASFRFKDSKTEQLPSIKLENIFSPGLFIVWGIPRTPISIGYGWQKGPQLRSVNMPDPFNSGQFINRNLNGYRWSFFLAVDIPLINFYTSSR